MKSNDLLKEPLPCGASLSSQEKGCAVAFIWDLDGTLLDSYKVIVPDLYDAFKDFPGTPGMEEISRLVITHDVATAIRKAAEAAGIPFEEMKARYDGISGKRNHEIRLIPGARKALEMLAAGGARHFVVTHRGSSSEDVLKRLGIYDIFDEIVTGRNGFPRKPAPDAVNYLVEKYGLDKALVCTYQAISGAGKNFDTWPEMVDNVIPYIGGEEEKSEQEPMKLWGEIKGDEIVDAVSPSITSQCIRVPVSDGHMAAVFLSFPEGVKPSEEEIKECWASYKGRAQELELPSAPKQFLHYFEDPSYPQTKLQRDLEGGMAISLGRLRSDSQYDYKFVGLSHNTLRGAAGGGVLLAELLCAEGYITRK